MKTMFAAALVATSVLAAAPIMAQTRTASVVTTPQPPPGGWWKLAYAGCEAYVTSAWDTATAFTIGGQVYGFRRGPSCNYSKATGAKNSTWVNVSRKLSTDR
jgi:hypothetical protein